MKPFAAVDSRDYFPQHKVAANEVYLSFVAPADAAAFREWLGDDGWAVFAKWLALRADAPAVLPLDPRVLAAPARPRTGGLRLYTPPAG